MSSIDDKAMLTDLYQLTMLAAYQQSGKADDVATFDLFVRKLPQDWGYFVAAGIEEAIDYATHLRFSEEDIGYLRSQELFTEEFLDSLKEFRFEGEISAVPEGTPVAPNTPILRVTAKRSQAQLLESTLLNIVNFQTMVATKASRVVHAANGAKVVDFGLRRAQGEDAGMRGARAAYIGGAVATSNVKAGKEYRIPISGTHAHSFVMSFASELEAFRAYVHTFPNNPTLLIDTYDTIQGARNAAVVAKELAQRGGRLGAVRLDSGDLCDLSKRVREILDAEGLSDVKIVASNDLNEHKIAEFVTQGAKIDGYGVGTEMITAKPVAAIGGVYKLVEDTDGAKIKLAPGKQTHPGRKQVYRVLGPDGKYAQDILALEGEHGAGTPLLEQVVYAGMRVKPCRALSEIRQYSIDCVAKLPDAVRSIRQPQQYPVSISAGLQQLVAATAGKYAAEHTEVRYGIA